MSTLPTITDDDRQFLSYNPNTEDIEQWVRAYATLARESLEAELSRAKAAIRELVKVETLRLKSSGWATTEEENKYLDANRAAAWATARAIAEKE